MKQHYLYAFCDSGTRVQFSGVPLPRDCSYGVPGGYALSQGLSGKEPASEVTHMVAGRTRFIGAVPNPMGPFLRQLKSIRPSR